MRPRTILFVVAQLLEWACAVPAEFVGPARTAFLSPHLPAAIQRGLGRAACLQTLWLKPSHRQLVWCVRPRMSGGDEQSLNAARNEGRNDGSTGRRSHGSPARGQSKSSIDGLSAQDHVVKMVEAVQALELVVAERTDTPQAAGGGALQPPSREAEDEVVRVLGMCARAAKGAGSLALAHALRVLETIRPTGSRSFTAAAAATPSTSPPSVYVYSAVIDVCAKAGAEDEARHVMRMMSADGVEPTVVSYSSLVAVFPADRMPKL